MGEARVRERLRLAGLPVAPPRERVTRYLPPRLASDLRVAEDALRAAAHRAGVQITEDQAFAAILRAGLATLPVGDASRGTPPPEGGSAVGSRPKDLTAPVVSP